MPNRSARSSQLWRLFCVLGSLEAAIATILLLTFPREGSGFSVPRLGALGLLCVALVGFGFAALKPRVPSAPRLEVAKWGLAVLVLLTGVALYLLRYLQPDTLLPFYARLSIPLLYLLVVGLEGLAILSVDRIQPRSSRFQRAMGILPLAAFAWLALLAIGALIAETRLGITPDPAYWGEPGVPILGWQLAFALLCGLLTFLVLIRRSHPRRVDAAIAVAVWLFAFVVWLLVPLDVLKNSFYAPIGPPANVPFPNSDAAYYDSMAQSLLIGHPYQGEIPSRPLYVVLLAGLHAIFGQRYDQIVIVQTLALGLIPAALYILGTAIHSRPAGVIAAMSAVGREWTSLAVSSATRVSNSKMLLVDLPTLLGLLACCLAILYWLRRQNGLGAVISGGVVGLLLLLRTQVLVLLPVMAGFVLLILGPRRRGSYAHVALFFAAVMVTLAPWLTHNFLATGHLSLDAAFQYRVIASQYAYTGNLDIQSMTLDSQSVPGILLAFLVRDPGFVAGFIANHALATLVGSVLALPLFWESPGLLAPVQPYWTAWNGHLSPQNLNLVIVYLAIIALGIASAWRRVRWAGMVPLILAVGYSLTNGIARFSGWRYDLPADWVAYFYLAVGVAEALLLAATLFGISEPASDRSATAAASPLGVIRLRPLLPVLVTFAVVGSLPWLATGLVGPRYDQAGSESLMARLSASASLRAAGISPLEIAQAQSSSGFVMEAGRALYPRFFTRGDGLSSAHPWPAFAPRDFPRLGFMLLNQTLQDVVIPTRRSPTGVEQGADAIVLGCQRDDYVEARLVLMTESDVLIQAAPITEDCR